MYGTDNPLLDAALCYAELGYPVFPCVPGGKTPLTAHGFKDATTDQDQIRTWWSRHPEANVAIATAGLLVLDLDGVDNPWPETVERIADLSEAGAIAKTPRGGSHRWYRQPEGKTWRNTGSQVADKVDTRANGGYVVVPPSRTADGEYLWGPGLELDVPPEQLPEPPGWFQEILDFLDEPRPRAESTASLMPGACLQDGNPIPEGYRDNTLTSLAGSMRRVGMTEDEIVAALLVTNVRRCVPPLAEDEVRRIARSVARYEPDQIATAVVEHHYDQDLGKVRTAGYMPTDPGPFPEHLLEVPGFIGDVMRYTLATAHRPLPTIALGGALALMGVLTGRKVRDEANARTNVYIFAVAPSGGGKDWPREVNKRILFKAEADHLVGPEKLASSAGLLAAVEEKRACLFQLDELGRHLKTMQDPRSAHLYGIMTELMTLYSGAGTTCPIGGYADTKRNKVLHQPHACLFATTVPESLYEGLTAQNITDGFMSRLFIFEAGMVPKRRQPSQEIPESIIDEAKWWANYKPSGNFSEEYPDPRVIPLTNSGREVLDWMAAESDRLAMSLPSPHGTIWTRAEEKANKLAMLYACSRDREDPKIDDCAAKWACELISFLANRVGYLVCQWVSENGFDAKRLRVLRIVTEAGASGITLSVLSRRTRFLTVRERGEVLENLKACGDITERRELTGGAPRYTYTATNIPTE